MEKEYGFLGTILVLEILDVIPSDIISDRLLDIFRYFCLDTVPDPPSLICYISAGIWKFCGDC